MNPSVQYFNKPMMYGSPFCVDANMVRPSAVNASSEPMGYDIGGEMISMDFIPSPVGFNNGRYGPIITANNGFLYAAGFSALPYRFIKIDPTTNIITSIYEGAVPAGMGGRRLVSSPTGTIINIPVSATTVGEFDTTTESFASFGVAPAGTNKYWGGVLASNGKIYCSPFSAASALVIDVINRTTATLGSFGGVSGKWGAPVLAPNGKIYCPPFAENRVLVIDPNNNDAIYFLKDNINNLAGNVSAVKYYNGTLAYDGKIYCIGYGARNVLVIDPDTDTCSSFRPINGNLLGSVFPNSGILASNGKIYASYWANSGTPQSNNVRIRELDPYTRAYSSIGIPERLNQIILSNSTVGGAYGGMCLAPSGKVYFSAHGSNFFAIVSGLPPATPDMWQVPKDLSMLPTSLFNYHSNGNGAL